MWQPKKKRYRDPDWGFFYCSVCQKRDRLPGPYCLRCLRVVRVLVCALLDRPLF